MKPDFWLNLLTQRPGAQPVDAAKLLYQCEFGCGHLLPDEPACVARIEEEWALTPPDEDEPPMEPIGGGLCRLNLRHPAVRALPALRIARMMRVTAEQAQGTPAGFENRLHALRASVARYGAADAAAGALPFTAEALDAYLQAHPRPWASPPRHSEAYRAAWRPAYRVVLRRYGEALPLLSAVEAHLRDAGHALLVVDGDCAAGKSTLAALVQPLYDATVFHMDDFFLPFAMRTPARMAEPGGNVHYERFAAQVLGGLRSGKPFAYQAFDCHRGQSRTVAVTPAAVVVVEGSYALHPAFAAEYAALHAVQALLTVDATEQLRRIRLRNGPEMLIRFRDEWIPLEFAYFQAYHRERTDLLTLHSQRHTEDEPLGEEPQP